MGKVTIRAIDVAQVVGLLREVGGDPCPRGDIRANAHYWAREMHGTMERHDLETVTWLLSEISAERQVPARYRRTAGYWASSLGARL